MKYIFCFASLISCKMGALCSVGAIGLAHVGQKWVFSLDTLFCNAMRKHLS